MLIMVVSNVLYFFRESIHKVSHLCPILLLEKQDGILKFSFKIHPNDLAPYTTSILFPSAIQKLRCELQEKPND